MSEVAIFSNPARRRRRRRKNAAKRRRRNPARHAAQGYTVGTKRIRRRKMNPIRHHRRRHRNPIGGEMGAVLIPAAIGAAGALGINILLGYITFLPASLQSGYGRAGVQIAAALGIGAFGPKMGLSRQNSYAIATGISLIAVYDVVSTLMAAKFPSISLGEQFNSLPTGIVHPGNAITGYGEQFDLPSSAANNYLPANTFGG